ncbi:hypothetical protein ACIQCQ_36180 [Streptomyces sp. NPDC088394]|uniref:hypothetical protein n=1 Tax=Streptomyces sp. NPDC088394 TaxID=3365860 RepID=UPI00380B8D8F
MTTINGPSGTVNLIISMHWIAQCDTSRNDLCELDTDFGRVDNHALPACGSNNSA